MMMALLKLIPDWREKQKAPPAASLIGAFGRFPL
jgi:hypothetical protein